MGPIHPSNIGGGRVVRSFRCGLIDPDRPLLAGRTLTREQILAMPTQNRNALIEKNFMLVWPPSTGAPASQSPAAVPSTSSQGVAVSSAGAEPSRRFVRPRGFGKYDVIEGVQLNDKALSKEEAYPLAGLPIPEERKTA